MCTVEMKLPKKTHLSRKTLSKYSVKSISIYPSHKNIFYDQGYFSSLKKYSSRPYEENMIEIII
jgi:hypothetical protein